jgi:hypothetical protein
VWFIGKSGTEVSEIVRDVNVLILALPKNHQYTVFKIRLSREQSSRLFACYGSPHRGGSIMSFRISPIWWPVLAVTSPLLAPLLVIRNRRFIRERVRVTELNQDRMSQAKLVEMPELEYLELTVLVEWKTRGDFVGDA